MTEYIDWAVGQKFGVMDINVPAYITHEEVGIPMHISGPFLTI